MNLTNRNACHAMAHTARSPQIASNNATAIPAVTELTVAATTGGRDAVRIVVRGASEAETLAIQQLICNDVEHAGGTVISTSGLPAWPAVDYLRATVTAGPAALVRELLASEEVAFEVQVLRGTVQHVATTHAAEVAEASERDAAARFVQAQARRDNRRAAGLARMEATRQTRLAARRLA